MDERVVARLESGVGHIRANLSKSEVEIHELRGDVRDAGYEIDRLRTEAQGESSRLRIEIGGLRTQIGDQRAEMQAMSARLRTVESVQASGGTDWTMRALQTALAVLVAVYFLAFLAAVHRVAHESRQEEKTLTQESRPPNT